MKYVMTLVNGDVLDLTEEDLFKFDQERRPHFTTSYGIRVYKDKVTAVYPEGSEPTEKMLKTQGRKKTTIKRMAGAKGKQTMIETYGEEGAAKIVGTGIPRSKRAKA